ncbi:hypothetical protein [Marinobacter sp. NFXS9]|uniref:hypothetical protein n=1 Tax=Marinobacter sp. NFXS9 TaxID=2818433 RepID=UPI0032DE71AF
MDKFIFFIERLVVRKSGRHIYDEKYHLGINVIRGDHSVGKTTILEVIFYVLGGEIKESQWLTPADLCDDVLCQLNVNGKVFTLKREIDKKSIPPIHIRSGNLELKDYEAEAWKIFGPRRSESNNKASFSQQIFELLGWDTHKSDDYANLTMHQILRFLYVDQETSSARLLRAEDNPRADSEGIRTAIFEFLLGLDNLDTHKLRQELLLTERQFEKISADLNAMYKLMGRDSTLTSEILENEVFSNLDSIAQLSDFPVETKAETDVQKERDKRFRKLDEKIRLLNRQLQAFKQDLLVVNGEIVDCEAYDKSLKYRKKSLLESRVSYEEIGVVEYNHCPSCMKELKNLDDDCCHLCHAPLDGSQINNNYIELITEIDFQLTSNQKVLDEYREHQSGLASTIKIAEGELKVAQQELESIAKMVNISSQKAIENSRKIGYLESQNKNLVKMMELIKELDKNKVLKVELNGRITEIRNKIEAATSSNQARRDKVIAGISENIVSIVGGERRDNGDPYEEVFADATESDIEIDFAKDRYLIDGRIKFSGSSNFVKKNAFHLAALKESLDDPEYRLPRFLMLDAIENGGMKPYRSHNFQKTIFNLFRDRKDFQLIFCTSMVLDELNNDIYGVGPYYEGNVLNL